MIVGHKKGKSYGFPSTLALDHDFFVRNLHLNDQLHKVYASLLEIVLSLFACLFRGR